MPVLGGTVTVREALYGRRFETNPNLFTFGGSTLPLGAPLTPSAVPLRFDIQIDAPPGSLRIDNKNFQIIGVMPSGFAPTPESISSTCGTIYLLENKALAL